MNIKHNRYVLFVGPIIWVITALSTPKTIEAGIFTIWMFMTTAYDAAEISHHKIYNYTPYQIGKWRKYTLLEGLMTCWFAAIGYPGLSILGVMFVNIFKVPYKLAFGLGSSWILLYITSKIIDLRWYIGTNPAWYGWFLCAWCLVRKGMIMEIETLGKEEYNATKQYTIIWLLRFLDQIIISSLRWFTWCDCVFPYVSRFDIWCYGMAMTIFCMWVVNHKRPQKILKFSSCHPGHMPAPDEETALACNKCRENQYTVDVEKGDAVGGYTLFEKEPPVTL